MRYSLRIELHDRRTAMVRALALIERRGFAIRGIATAAGEPGRSRLDVVVEHAARPIEGLRRQLAKLVEVVDTEVVGG